MDMFRTRQDAGRQLAARLLELGECPRTTVLGLPRGGVPVAVAGGLHFRSIVAASWHSCGIATSGDAYCWGLDDGGQLGAGTVAGSVCGTAPCSFVPVKVAGGHEFKMLAERDRATIAELPGPVAELMPAIVGGIR